jgi:hypothetical protein
MATSRPDGVDFKKIEKAMVLQKPEGWDGGLEVQEKLFDIITSRLIWLCIRIEINEQGLIKDRRKRWYERYPTFLECFWNTIVKAFAECIDQFGYSVRYEADFDRSLQRSKQLFTFKQIEGYETVYKLLDYIYILEDTYRVYNYDEEDE